MHPALIGERLPLLISKELFSMEPWLTLGYTEECLFRHLHRFDPALRRYAISVSEKVVGVAWLRGPCLELLAVFASKRAGGIGREIVFWIENECRKSSSNIWTLTSSFNEAARKFYRNAGFSEFVIFPNLVADGFDEILLRKKIRHFGN